MGLKQNFTLIFLVVILILAVIQTGLSVYQYTRYGPDNNCVDMSRKTECFLESIGLRVWQMTGSKEGGPEGGGGSHRWILVDLYFFTIPFESTALFPGWNPAWSGYKNLSISDGYVVDGERVPYYFQDWTRY